MADHGYELEHLNASYPEIQAESLEETIVPGLTWLVSKFERPVMIDDSGFFVDALKGFPGVYSSYVFKTIGCEGILRLMAGRSDRSARFECCVGFMAPGREQFVAKGVSRGEVTLEMRGSGGFGYDPIFVNEGHTKTYAELDVIEKNKVSHRGKAIEAFVSELPRLL
jgi:XTP/dITP diphosphohydrolase